MAVLVGYESSDDENEIQPGPAAAKPLEDVQEKPAQTDGESTTILKPEATAQPVFEQPGIIGPMLLPEETSNPRFPPLEDALMEDSETPALALPPGSPYSANRALLRDLTLPTVTNMDIPPSPPGSPPPGTNKKFEQFLELKKKGVHFNSKIAQSSALKNPGLMDKLLNFVDIDQKDQYKTTLGTDLWDPTGFPKAAYKEQLRQSQNEIGQARARTKGGAVEFVAGVGVGGSRDTTPGTAQATAPLATSTGKRKTRFDA